MRKVRSALLTLVAVATAVLVIQGTASASPTPPYPGSTPALDREIATQLQQYPGGVRIDARTVSYNHGAVLVVMSVASSAPRNTPTVPAATPSCSGGWLCLYQDDDYAGRRWQFHDEGYIQNLANYGATPFYSFYNNRSHRWFLHTGDNGTGAVACYQAQARVSAMDPNWAQSRSIYLATTNNQC